MADTVTSMPVPRQRMSRDQRLAQLMEVAWRLIRDEGTDALTLGRLAEAAGVTKPVVYDHFGTRQGLLAALYRDFDLRQRAIMDEAVAASGPTLEDKANVIASSYISCVLAEGSELPGVVAALSGSPDLALLKKECQVTYIEKCRGILAPFAGPEGIPKAALWAMLGAAEALSSVVLSGDVTEQEARRELCDLIAGIVDRNG